MKYLRRVNATMTLVEINFLKEEELSQWDMALNQELSKFLEQNLKGEFH